jgi:hypothetical protein
MVTNKIVRHLNYTIHFGALSQKYVREFVARRLGTLAQSQLFAEAGSLSYKDTNQITDT